MKKTIIILIIAAFPLGVFAKENWKVSENRNTLALTGSCVGSGSVRIDLFSKNEPGEAVYTSGAWCRNGQFEFENNLLESNLESGEYELAVNGSQNKNEVIYVERIKEIPVSADKADGDFPSEDSSDTPETKFFSSFLSLQQSILDMRTGLAKTNYSSIIKTSLDMVIDGIYLATGKITDLLWSAENQDAVVAEDEVNIPNTHDLKADMGDETNTPEAEIDQMNQIPMPLAESISP